MNYNNIYNCIIYNAKLSNRKKSESCYFENHHIIPLCCNGPDSKDNKVLLTAKEHFICHHLLTKIYPSNAKLKFAFWAMCNQLSGDVNRTYKITSTIYEQSKREFSKINSLRHQGKTMPESFSKFMSARMKENNIHKPGKDSHLYGIPRAAEIIQKISQTKLDNPEKNASFKGYYITPFGKFASSEQASRLIGLSVENLRRRCSKSQTIITIRHIRMNTDLSDSDNGKTFKELGWDFEPVPR